MNFNRLAKFFKRNVKEGHIGGDANNLASQESTRRPFGRVVKSLAVAGVITAAMLSCATMSCASDLSIPKGGSAINGKAIEGKILDYKETDSYIATTTQTKDGRLIIKHVFKENTDPCKDMMASEYYSEECRESRDAYFSQYGRGKYDWQKRQDEANRRAKADWRYADKMGDGSKWRSRKLTGKLALKIIGKSLKHELDGPNGNPELRKWLDKPSEYTAEIKSWVKNKLPESERTDKTISYVEDALSNGGASLWTQKNSDSEEGWDMRLKRHHGFKGAKIEIKKRGNLDDLFGLLKK